MNNAMGAARSENPADLLIKDGRVLNILSGEIRAAGVSVYGHHFL